MAEARRRGFGKMLSDFISSASALVWGIPLISLFLATHLYMTFRTGIVQRHIFHAVKISLQPAGGKNSGDISSFSALSTALAATIGTGNIAGVATAVTLGGPGAVFWMWIIGVFAFATKYAESLLAVKYRVKRANGMMAGGAMYVIERGMGSRWKWLAVTFAVLTAVSSFGIGNMVQANTISDLLDVNYGIPEWCSGLFFAAITAVTVLGGIRAIARICAALMPFVVVLYIVLCLALLFVYAQAIPSAISLIFTSAFDGHAAAGGFCGATMAQALRFGAARGLFSNESGMGSAPIVAAAARTRSAVRQALISASGTFWDTVIMCALMGLVLVASGSWCADGPDGQGFRGIAVTREAFAGLGFAGKHLLALITLLVVVSTIFGWSYYGERAVEYLFGDRSVIFYRLFWVAAVYVGSVCALDDMFNLSDIANGLMCIPNIIAMFALNGVVAKETKRYFSNVKTSPLNAEDPEFNESEV